MPCEYYDAIGIWKSFTFAKCIGWYIAKNDTITINGLYVFSSKKRSKANGCHHFMFRSWYRIELLWYFKSVTSVHKTNLDRRIRKCLT